ncbi:MAG: hypothetical protein EA411_03280 [Saprospirales bacterium]|nr:MAG: hypothetical protein EA411_03280 [Saprospirales bacterium]
MNYELRIENLREEGGAIDLNRLTRIANCIRRVSEGALQIRLKGISLKRGRKKISLQNALRVSLTGMQKGNTVLSLETERFEKTLEPYQTNLFLVEAQVELPNENPISLFIKTFQLALAENNDKKDLLDKPLLQELKKLRKAFYKVDEIITFSSEDKTTELEIRQSDFDRIKDLEDEIPNPQTMVLNGAVDMLQYSNLKVKIKTEEGFVFGFLSDGLSPKEIASLWGKEAIFTGTSYFKPGGRSIIEIEEVYECGPGDSYFTKNPQPFLSKKGLPPSNRDGSVQAMREFQEKWLGPSRRDPDLDQLPIEFDPED